MEGEPHHSQDGPDMVGSSNKPNMADHQCSVDAMIQNASASRGSLTQGDVENTSNGDKAMSLPQAAKSMSNNDAGSHPRIGRRSSFLMVPSPGGN